MTRSIEHQLSKAQQEEIASRYQKNESTLALGAAFDVSKGAINAMLRRRGVELRTASQASTLRMRKYSCDHAFFKAIDSEAKAYWLGFIASDGNVYGRALSIGLAEKDAEHLHRFRDAISSTHRVKTHPRYGSLCRGKAVRSTNCAMLVIKSLELTTDLAQLGIVPCKSLFVEWPEVPHNLRRHFLRGLFDGDGCWTVRRQSNYSRTRFNLCGSEQMMIGAQQFLMIACNLGQTKLYRNPHAGNVFNLSYGGNQQVARIIHLLYHDAAIYLPRKADVIRPYSPDETKFHTLKF